MPKSLIGAVLALALCACSPVSNQFATGTSSVPFMGLPDGSTVADLAIRAQSNRIWQNYSFPTMNSGFSLNFDAVPDGNAINAMTSLSNGAASSSNPGALMLRFNSAGMIDAINGSGYAAVSPIAYQAGVTYHFEVDVNVTTRNYSAIVTPDGQIPQVLAVNYKFASAQATVSSLNDIGVQASLGSHEISRVSITVPISTGAAPAAGPVPAPGSAPAPAPAPGSGPSANGTTVPPATALMDASGATYTLVNGQIAKNGTIDPRTAQVTLLLYFNGMIYQQATSRNLWWFTDGSNWPNSSWTQVSGDPRSSSGSTPAPGPAPAPAPAPAPLPSSGSISPPPAAQAVGMTRLLYDEEFKNSSGIDVNDSGAPGFNLYRRLPFRFQTLPTDRFGVSPTINGVGNGVLRVNSLQGPNMGLISACSDGHGGWIGFAPKPPFYIEAAIAFDPNTPNHGNGWPSVWTMAAEFLFGGTGSAFMELDWFEYDTRPYDGNPFSYGGAVHHWGPGGTTNNRSNENGTQVIVAPSSTNWKNSFTAVGGYVVPGNGIYMTLNGQKTSDQNPYSRWSLFQIADGEHFPVIVGFDGGDMYVDWIRVWGP